MFQISNKVIRTFPDGWRGTKEDRLSKTPNDLLDSDVYGVFYETDTGLEYRLISKRPTVVWKRVSSDGWKGTREERLNKTSSDFIDDDIYGIFYETDTGLEYRLLQIKPEVVWSRNNGSSSLYETLIVNTAITSTKNITLDITPCTYTLLTKSNTNDIICTLKASNPTVDFKTTLVNISNNPIKIKINSTETDIYTLFGKTHLELLYIFSNKKFISLIPTSSRSIIV